MLSYCSYAPIISKHIIKSCIYENLERIKKATMLRDKHEQHKNIFFMHLQTIETNIIFIDIININFVVHFECNLMQNNKLLMLGFIVDTEKLRFQTLCLGVCVRQCSKHKKKTMQRLYVNVKYKYSMYEKTRRKCLT